MKKAVLILLCACLTGLTASGQNKKQPVKPTVAMNTALLTNETVKKAFEAWQNGDAVTWLSLFTPDARLYDDGSPRDFRQFVKSACGRERFTSLDKVENGGMDLYGNFHTESWGDFKTYFKFHSNGAGKFDRLDIGQAK